ncbi:hypothetical protein DPMN_043811 [Dreissena polymorpha]|uniref:Uncharacterized protein n=1 Tax=Dreissena polymorpha TaxID=45954 RepID=A0A9D4HY72_DREPO|nr:hypothetical protein DPMN_043811 [Dreissena polymorpha]
MDDKALSFAKEPFSKKENDDDISVMCGLSHSASLRKNLARQKPQSTSPDTATLQTVAWMTNRDNVVRRMSLSLPGRWFRVPSSECERALIFGHSQVKYMHQYLKSEDIITLSYSGFTTVDLCEEESIFEIVPSCKVVVIVAGANDIGHSSPAEIVSDFQQLCEKVRSANPR